MRCKIVVVWRPSPGVSLSSLSVSLWCLFVLVCVSLVSLCPLCRCLFGVSLSGVSLVSLCLFVLVCVSLCLYASIGTARAQGVLGGRLRESGLGADVCAREGQGEEQVAAARKRRMVGGEAFGDADEQNPHQVKVRSVRSRESLTQKPEP
jgi:hypothetical protein